VLFIFQFRICLTYPDLRIRDSSFLKVAHRTRWRAVGGGHGDGPGYSKQGGIQRVKLQNKKAVQDDFSCCKATNRCCRDLIFRNLCSSSTLVFTYSNASNSHIPQYQGPIL